MRKSLFKVDRWITLYLVRPARRMWAGRSKAIPILMYHSISDEDESDVHPYYRVSTSPSMFRKQMTWLHSKGFQTIGLEQIDGRRNGEGFPDHPVVITFDDGYRNFYTAAFPVLENLGFSSTVFLPTAFIGASSSAFKGRLRLSWDEVRELHGLGVSFGSHTVRHSRLTELTSSELESELRDSKRSIEDEINSEVDSFSFPYAFPESDRTFTALVRGKLQEIGYRRAVTTVIGRAGAEDDLLKLKRLPVSSSDDSLLFEAKLTGSYDWLRRPQKWSKDLRQTLRHAPVR